MKMGTMTVHGNQSANHQQVVVHDPAAHREVPSLASWLFGTGDSAEKDDEEEVDDDVHEVRGCEIQGYFYEVGAIVESASGPCLQCR